MQSVTVEQVQIYNRIFISHSLDSGNDGKISKEEFLSDDVKNILQKVKFNT